MQHVDGRLMKFKISFVLEALQKPISKGFVMSDCLIALGTQSTIFVMPATSLLCACVFAGVEVFALR